MIDAITMQSTVSSQTALFPCYDLKLVAWKADIYHSHNSLNRCFDVNIQQISSTLPMSGDERIV